MDHDGPERADVHLDAVRAAAEPPRARGAPRASSSRRLARVLDRVPVLIASSIRSVKIVAT
ncbi:hypothetical protein SCE1572_40835 [Sorangium cellulosum So0157-2]|uniref:Uncharacterized protein n=1 Tax=Sorangium cellulosum So0157-2 TaxID=1254432 RepID=S4Y7B0_SORCE|nr:hypothetical protein SCE1572_40835 [Sorangium cellulosum So0157-2]